MIVLNDHEENLEKATGEPDQDIKNGFVNIDGRKIPFSERVISEKIKIILPTEYKQMEKRYIKVKYPAYKNKDMIILTNKDTTINFMFDFKDGYVEPDELEEIRDHLLDVLKEVHPTLVFLEKATIETDILKIVYFEIVTPALDKDIYNFMYFFIVNDNLVVATFNCFDDEKETWQPIIRQVAESLQVV